MRGSMHCNPHWVWILCFVILNPVVGRADFPFGFWKESQPEMRKQIDRDCRKDAPYSQYILAIADEADKSWPTLSFQQQGIYRNEVYNRLADASQLANDQIKLKIICPSEDRPYLATVSISMALDVVPYKNKRDGFYREVFGSADFKQTSSAFKDVVIDLWTKYEWAGKPVPHTQLLLLNQPKMGTPDGQTGDTFFDQIGKMYGELGQRTTEAEWYAKISDANVGPLKAADAFFDCKEYARAKSQYEIVLNSLEQWRKLKPTLSHSAVCWALSDTDLDKARQHSLERLTQVNKFLATPLKTPVK